MNRRNFLQTLGAAVASFAILPSATTYARKWVKQDAGIYVLNPDYFNAQYEINWFYNADSLDKALKPIIYDRFLPAAEPWPYGAGNVVREPVPMRFATLDDGLHGRPIPVMVKHVKTYA